MTFNTEIEKSTIKFMWKHQRLWTTKAKLSKQSNTWRYHNTQPQNILQSHNNKNSMALAQKQIWRPVEQNRCPEYESTASIANVSGKIGYLPIVSIWN
jgi:hypothetical protein